MRHPNLVGLAPIAVPTGELEQLTLAEHQVKLYVSYLRRKLREAGARDDPIETVRGFGYRYRPVTLSNHLLTTM